MALFIILLSANTAFYRLNQMKRVSTLSQRKMLSFLSNKRP